MQRFFLTLFTLILIGCGGSENTQAPFSCVETQNDNFRFSQQRQDELLSSGSNRWIIELSHKEDRDLFLESLPSQKFRIEKVGTDSVALDWLNATGKVAEMQRLVENSLVVDVESDSMVYSPRAIPSSPVVDKQWHHETLESERGWEVSAGSPQITVAVIDSGVDFHHPDLRGQAWQNPDEIANNGIDDDGNGLIDDVHGWDYVEDDNHASPSVSNSGGYHGTHVAGVIAGQWNSKGYAGVAPDIKIMSLKFLDHDKKGRTSNGIKAIHYAIDHGAHIINLSWGSFKRNELLVAALQRAKREGILVTAAAGNVGSNNDSRPFYPASYKLSNILSVTASSQRDKSIRGINYGPKSIHLAAPGLNILSTDRNSSYVSRTGSSMAAPLVAAAAALLLSIEPDLTMDELRELILAGSTKVNGLRSKVREGRRLSVSGSVKKLLAQATVSKGEGLAKHIESPETSVCKSF